MGSAEKDEIKAEVQIRHLFVWSLMKSLLPSSCFQPISVTLPLCIFVGQSSSDQREDLVEVCNAEIISIIDALGESLKEESRRL
jgi:hypothetical protein